MSADAEAEIMLMMMMMISRYVEDLFLLFYMLLFI